MSSLQSCFLLLLGILLAPELLLPLAAAQTMGAMDTHVRRTIPTEKEELIIEGVCAAFLSRPSSEILASCGKLKSFIQVKNWEEAMGLAEKLGNLNPDNGLGCFWIGYIDLLQGKKTTAVKFLESAVEKSKDVSLAHINLGLGYLKIRQSRLFEKEMHWVIENHPEDPRPYYFLGRFLAEDLERLDEGAKYFQQAINRDPNDYRSRFHVGLTWEMKGELAQAKAEYEMAVALVDTSLATYAYPLEGLARLAWQQQNPSEALHYAQKAVSLDPSLASGRLMLGNLYLQTGADEDAIAELKIAVHLDPADPAPHYMLARAYRKLKRSAEARQEEELFSQLKSSCQEK